MRAPGVLMVDLRGLELAADEMLLLQRGCVGGVVLFARNFEGFGAVAGTDCRGAGVCAGSADCGGSGRRAGAAVSGRLYAAAGLAPDRRALRSGPWPGARIRRGMWLGDGLGDCCGGA